MSKTLWQMRDAVMEAIHSYEITDDRVIEPEMVEDKLVDLRSSLIAEEEKYGYLDQSYFQLVENIEVIYGDHSIVLDGMVNVTKPKSIGVVQMPWINTRIGRKAIQYFGLPDLSYNFDNKTLLGLISNDAAMFTNTRYVYTVSGKQAFVKNYGREGKRYVSVIAILDDPRQNPGFDLETSEFPVSDPQKLELLVIKHFLSTMGFPPDKINDANINLQQK
jgi:hypothetical protein